MENLDVMVLRTLRDWRRAGKRALLTTVVRTWGSSPRPVGSIMALGMVGFVFVWRATGSVELGMLAALLVGSGAGLVNGILGQLRREGSGA